MTASKITVYGADDCEETRRVRAFLDSHGAHYEFVDINLNKEAERLVKNENDGKRRTPLVQVCVGTECRVLRVPSDEDLDAALQDLGPLKNAA